METVIYEDSALAEFLHGMAGTENELIATTKPDSSPSTDSESISFAPRGIPQARVRKRQAPISQVTITKSPLSRLRQKCIDTFAWRIGRSDQIKALEQLRFTIIGSQLLNDRSINGGSVRKSSTSNEESIEETPIEYTNSGLAYVAGAAFSCALSLRWATETLDRSQRRARLAVISTIVIAVCLAVYGFCLRQYRKYARTYAVRTATALVGNAQAFDSNAYGASSFIQEVELISRGYKLGSPLPPASRLDDSKTQTRRCQRLRHSLRSGLDELIILHVAAYKSLHSFANAANLERYYDMYEISRSDIDELLEIDNTRMGDDSEVLRVLKVDLHRLFMVRKIFLCSILALDTDCRSSSLDWNQITEIMRDVSHHTGMAAKALEDILDEEQYVMPPSPRDPQTPNRERSQPHTRRLASLSQGLRGLQAKTYILREESDRWLESTDEATLLGNYFLEQYDAIGNDIKNLLSEWEEGRTVIASNTSKNERRRSSHFTAASTNLLSRSSSRSSSLGGLTAVGGSPNDALRVLNGEIPIGTDMGSLEEEVYEALASPKSNEGQKFSREERIAKMREERLRIAAARERIDATRFMVKELETVIKARPHYRKASSPMAPVPVRIAATTSPVPTSPTLWTQL